MKTLRYITPVDATFWGERGYEYLAAIVAAALPVKAVAATLADFTDAHSRWYLLRDVFVRPQPDNFVNVVVGFGSMLDRYHTPGVANVVITGVYPRSPSESDLVALRKYDHICGITDESTRALAVALNRGVRLLNPDAIDTVHFLRGFL